MILPTFKGGGTHVNISGVVLARYAPNKANAMKLIEWLAGETGAADARRPELRVSDPRRRRRSTRRSRPSARSIPIRCRSPSIADKSKAAANLVDKVGFDN